MPEKPVITSICAVALIYWESDPSQILIDIKNDGHPIPAMRRKFCPIGGNWIGFDAVTDRNPLDTLIREIKEELSLDPSVSNTGELKALGYVTEVMEYEIERNAAEVTAIDRAALHHLKQRICAALIPFGDYIKFVPKSVLDAADFDNKRGDITDLCSYFTAGLGKEEWETLLALLKKFGNISNESCSVVTSLESMITRGVPGAFGHDHALQRFFFAKGLPEAVNLPMTYGVTSTYFGMQLPTYTEYLKKLKVLKKPTP